MCNLCKLCANSGDKQIHTLRNCRANGLSPPPEWATISICKNHLLEQLRAGSAATPRVEFHIFIFTHRVLSWNVEYPSWIFSIFFVRLVQAAHSSFMLLAGMYKKTDISCTVLLWSLLAVPTFSPVSATTSLKPHHRPQRPAPNTQSPFVNLPQKLPVHCAFFWICPDWWACSLDWHTWHLCQLAANVRFSVSWAFSLCTWGMNSK